mgnify:CR=1 FL=1
MGRLSQKKSAREQPVFLPERGLFHLTRREAAPGRGAPASSGMSAPVCLPTRLRSRWAQKKVHPGRSEETSRCTCAFSSNRSSTAGTTACCETYSWHTKKYELLYQQIELLDRENSHKCVSPAECRAAHRAYAILLQDIGKPPSLPELAAAVGVNRTRLTALFRMLFEDTVFGILRRERLECARRLLNEKGKNITEIAYLCGFSSPSHLTKAFSAQFGISPKQYQIARRHGHPAASVSCDEQHT